MFLLVAIEILQSFCIPRVETAINVTVCPYFLQIWFYIWRKNTSPSLPPDLVDDVLFDHGRHVEKSCFSRKEKLFQRENAQRGI